MLISIINLTLSPFCLILYLFCILGKESKYLVPTKETNVSKLALQPYLIFTLAYLSVMLGMTYLWSCISSVEFDMWQVFIPKYYWLSIITWCITAFTIFTYLKGMEGNIMGFIFFPMLAISVVAFIGVNFKGILSDRWILNGPKFEYGFWVGFVLHTFFSSYVLLMLNQKDKENQNWVESIISIILLQMIFFAINWTIVWLFGDNSLSFYQFFGEGQTIFYYVPMLGGFIYFVKFFLPNTALEKNTAGDIAMGMLILINLIFVLFQAANYFRIMTSYF